jgi:uncharacterized peroxidase-related enzyme
VADFPVHSPDSAPAAARPLLEASRRTQGQIFNIVAEMAASPAVLEGYLGLGAAFRKSGLTPTEREVVLIATSAENRCHYCTAAHTTAAEAQGLDKASLAAIRAGAPVTNRRLEALRAFTTKVVRERGFVADADVRAFQGAGFSQANVLEVVLGVGLKTISNYVNHIAETPLDSAFEANAFTPPSAAPV